MNCNAWTIRTIPHKKFCSVKCKDEYRHYGSAFGPLRDYLTKLIVKASNEEAGKQFAAYVAEKDFRRHMAAAGFIHRSMLKPKEPELTPERLRSQIRETEKRLEAQIAQLWNAVSQINDLALGRTER